MCNAEGRTRLCIYVCVVCGKMFAIHIHSEKESVNIYFATQIVQSNVGYPLAGCCKRWFGVSANATCVRYSQIVVAAHITRNVRTLLEALLIQTTTRNRKLISLYFFFSFYLAFQWPNKRHCTECTSAVDAKYILNKMSESK